MAKLLPHEQNRATQPVKTHKVFNNWNVVAKGYYYAFRSDELKSGQVKSVNLCGQHIAIYRSESGKLAAMDGYCPHMGVDLGIGKVQGEHLRCFFHHWKFAADGKCVDIPCKEAVPNNAKLQTYVCIEKYGCIFVWPDEKADEEFVTYDEFTAEESVYHIDPPFARKCHHHVNMINGLDPQHLRTVHNVDIEMNLDMENTSPGVLDITLAGKLPIGNLKEKVARTILGESYSYSMRYAHGTVGALTLMKNVKLFNRWSIPALHMIYCYRPVEPGKTEVIPIYINKKRSSLLGKAFSRFQLWLTKRLFYMLRGEDGEVYENIRFKTESLLKIDLPVARYVGYINKQRPSVWSKELGE